jgi:hypothetical protein
VRYKVEVIESPAFIFIAYVFCTAIASVISLPGLILVLAGGSIEMAMIIPRVV